MLEKGIYISNLRVFMRTASVYGFFPSPANDVDTYAPGVKGVSDYLSFNKAKERQAFIDTFETLKLRKTFSSLGERNINKKTFAPNSNVISLHLWVTMLFTAHVKFNAKQLADHDLLSGGNYSGSKTESSPFKADNITLMKRVTTGNTTTTSTHQVTRFGDLSLINGGSPLRLYDRSVIAGCIFTVTDLNRMKDVYYLDIIKKKVNWDLDNADRAILMVNINSPELKRSSVVAAGKPAARRRSSRASAKPKRDKRDSSPESSPLDVTRHVSFTHQAETQDSLKSEFYHLAKQLLRLTSLVDTTSIKGKDTNTALQEVTGNVLSIASTVINGDFNTLLALKDATAKAKTEVIEDKKNMRTFIQDLRKANLTCDIKLPTLSFDLLDEGMNKKLPSQFKGNLEWSDWIVIGTDSHKMIYDTYHDQSDKSSSWCATLVKSIKAWENKGWTSSFNEFFEDHGVSYHTIVLLKTSVFDEIGEIIMTNRENGTKEDEAEEDEEGKVIN